MKMYDEAKLDQMLLEAHYIKNGLLRPIEERQKAAQAISHAIMVAAEYRAQRNALRVLLREATALVPLDTKVRTEWLRRAGELLPTDPPLTDEEIATQRREDGPESGAGQ